MVRLQITAIKPLHRILPDAFSIFSGQSIVDPRLYGFELGTQHQ